jgi:signal transduction histidine kinase
MTADQAITGDAKPATATRVLLIEDNVGFAYFVSDVLMRQSPGRFLVEQAHTLADGLAILDRGGIDVALIDLGLPDSTRIQTFSKARAHAPHVPIIILTVLDDDEVALQAMRAGAQDYLVKERVDKHLLVRAICYAIERARADQALHQLSARLIDLQDAERRRIARDLHDTTAQTLAALGMNMALLKRGAEPMTPEFRSLLAESIDCVEQCATQVRTMAYLLHPPLLDELGLAGAVRDYADGFAERSGIRVDLELPDQFGAVSKDAERTFFRVMQECLTNIHRHSGSPTASIRFDRDESGVRLVVQDKGRGMPPGNLNGSAGTYVSLGVGIAGMRERVRQLGGHMQIQSDQAGTTVTAFLPLGGGPA